MKINTLSVNTEVTVEVIAQGKSVNLKSNVIEAVAGNVLQTSAGKQLHIDAPCCLVQLITVNDKPVRLDNEQFTIRVYASCEDAYYLWQPVRIEIVLLPNGKKCHAIFSEKEGLKVNRRGSYRLSVGKKFAVQFGENGRTSEVTLKDISVNGVGFLVPPDIQCQEGTRIRFMFKDTYYALSLKLEGTVVRVTPVREDCMLVGCRLQAMSPRLEKYIYDQQRSKLQVQRQGVKSKVR